MSSYIMRFGNRSDDMDDYQTDSMNDVEMYDKSCKEAKKGIAIIMEGIENGDTDAIEMGAARAWKGIKTMKKLSDKMKLQFGSRRGSMGMRSQDGDGMSPNGSWSHANDGREWNKRDDEMMERRMREVVDRYM